MSLLALIAAGVDTPEPQRGQASYDVEAFITDDSNYVATATLSPGQSIQDAIIALAAQTSTPAYDRSPHDRARLTIPPGTYTERIWRRHSAHGSVVDIVGQTLDPADVIITSPDGAEDTIELSGTSGIYAGLTVRATHAPTGPATAAAIHNGEGRDGEYVFWRVVAEATNGGAAFSWGAESGGSLFVLDSIIASTLYCHNFADATRPTWVQIEDTEVASASLLSAVGHPDDALCAVRSPGLHNPIPYNGATAATATWGHVDPSLARRPHDQNPLWAEFWMPDGRGVSTQLQPVPSTGYATLPTDRIYYIPFRLPAFHDVPGWSLDWETTSGAAQVGLREGLTFPSTALAWPEDGGTFGLLRALAPGRYLWAVVRVSDGTALAVGDPPPGTLYLDGGGLTDTPTGASVLSGPCPAITLNLT